MGFFFLVYSACRQSVDMEPITIEFAYPLEHYLTNPAAVATDAFNFRIKIGSAYERYVMAVSGWVWGGREVLVRTCMSAYGVCVCVCVCECVCMCVCACVCASGWVGVCVACIV